MENTNNIVKICSALSNKPIFVRINDPISSIDTIINEAILTLKNSGRSLDAHSLEELYKSHQIFSNGKVIEKGDLFSELPKSIQSVGEESVNMLELDLISSHSGGIDIYTEEFKKLVIDSIKPIIMETITDLPELDSLEFVEHFPNSFSVYFVMKNYNIRNNPHGELMNVNDYRIKKGNHECYTVRTNIRKNKLESTYLDISVVFH